MNFFAEMGAMIERRWRDENYNHDAFPAIAEQALNELPPNQHVDVWDIVRWLFATTEIPTQQDVPGKFGDPPITLYSGPRFHIDVYFWLDGTTSVHQHAFCGAFHVLAGASIHSQYTFHPQQFINEHFGVGEIKLEQVELLEQGQSKQILPGKAYIHSLFHLDRPSATICVRTYHTSSNSPQYNFVKPHFAIDPFFHDPFSTKHTQSVALLLRMQHSQAIEMIDDLLTRADFQTTFSVLDLAWGFLGGKRLENEFGLATGETQFNQLMETARQRHGKLVDLIPDVFKEVRRQNTLINRRGQITSAEHRFFLALLLNVPNREKVLAMVEQRFPDRNPVETITDWVEELANTKLWGATDPNVLGIENYDEDYLFVFEQLLQGASYEQMMQALADESSAEYALEQQDKLVMMYDSITSSLLFHSLFAESPALSLRREAAIAV
jgi:hypothetical protein